MEREIKSKVLVKFLVCSLWLILFLFFLFVGFPYETFIRWAEIKVERGSDIELSIEGVSIRKDLSFSIDSMEIRKEINNAMSGITLTKVSFKPNIGMLLGRAPAFRFSGKISSDGWLEGNYKGGEIADININWNGVGMKDIQLPLPSGLPVLSNPTKGEAFLNITNKDMATGSESLIVQLKGSGFPSNELKLSAVAISNKEILYGKITASLKP